MRFDSAHVLSAIVAHLILGPNAVSAQIPQEPTGLRTVTAPNGAIIRYKEPGKAGICETTVGVNS